MNDGGPAFPNFERRPLLSGQVPGLQGGMSLRDYFAAAAFSTLAQMVFGGHGQQVELKRELDEEAFAIQAYKFADALLAERERTEK